MSTKQIGCVECGAKNVILIGGLCKFCRREFGDLDE